MGLTKQLVYIGDFHDEAERLKSSWGRTDLYSTGHKVLDDYFFGGFGRKDGYEIVLMYGPTGIGKSTVALNMLAPSIVSGVNVGLLVLEDSMADVSNRMAQILTASQYEAMNRSTNVRCLPNDALVRSWNLNDLLTYIEDWFSSGVDLILLDHLQFAFENAESLRGENEYVAQRSFMQKLNQLIKRMGKTIILISHMAKDSKLKGMSRIVGSGALPQAATKVISVVEGDVKEAIKLQLEKSRFTPRPDHAYNVKLKNGVLRTVYE